MTQNLLAISICELISVAEEDLNIRIEPAEAEEMLIAVFTLLTKHGIKGLEEWAVEEEMTDVR